ncbi:hypothetical protein EVA_06082 [gut metagenome]|uniref:Uncharacterized protein n=1 Tax=gut metagenome TaxID=749906 RepID=J9GSY7_9ZZZZ
MRRERHRLLHVEPAGPVLMDQRLQQALRVLLRRLRDAGAHAEGERLLVPPHSPDGTTGIKERAAENHPLGGARHWNQRHQAREALLEGVLEHFLRAGPVLLGSRLVPAVLVLQRQHLAQAELLGLRGSFRARSISST